MYIWRGKTRRDRRHWKLSGLFGWGAPKGSYNTSAEDDLLRQEGEEAHVGYFHDRLRIVMHQYLSTKNGMAEVDIIIRYLEEEARLLAIKQAEEEALAVSGGGKPLDHSKIVVVPAEMKKKKNIYEIFRKYDADGSGSIDMDELKVLLEQLKVPMTDEELEDLFDELDEDGGGEIDFEEFYEWFVKEADAQQQKKSRWTLFKSKESGGVFEGFKRLVLEVEARNLTMDEAVWKGERDARIEYRIAHPPKYLCHRCGESFATYAAHKDHEENDALHVEKEAVVAENLARYAKIEAVLLGPHGRNILANRLLFSTELCSLETRIKIATETPFRPMIDDKGGKRRQQMLNGMFVTGSDPTVGIRAGVRKFAMIRQHHSERHSRDGLPSFQDVLVGLLHVRDSAIDIVTAPNTAAHAEVAFTWNGYAATTPQVRGEFNGWKPEDLLSNRQGGCTLIKMLGPGKYRYRYFIDGVDRLDENASIVEEPGQPPCNIILVINPVLGSMKSTGVVTERGGGGGTLEPLDSPGGRSQASSMSVETATSKLTFAMNDGGGDEEQYQLQQLESGGARAAHHQRHVGKGQEKIEANAMNYLKGLTKVSLRNRSLYDDGAWAFAAYIQSNSQIQQIDLSFNGISAEGAQAISSALPRMHVLNTMKMNGNGIGCDGCRYLSNVLIKSSTLTHLELSSNNIGDDGAEEIATKLVKGNKVLKHLFLDSNLIGNEGAASIATALIHNRTLTSLSLSKNNILTRGAEIFCEAVSSNATLTSLKLDSNPLGAEGTKSVGIMLASNDTLNFLDISNTDLLRGRSGAGITAICFSLRTNRFLRTLCLRNNGIYEALAVDIAHMLTFNKGLTKIDLDGNPLDVKWFVPNSYLTTRVSRHTPTIRTSLDYNIKAQSDPELAAKYGYKKEREVDKDDDGYWTLRRKWKKVNRKAEERRALQLLGSEEEIRIQLEEEYIAENLAKHLAAISNFLETPECDFFICTLCDMINKHFKDLLLIDRPPLTPEEQKLADEAAAKKEEEAKKKAAEEKRLAEEAAKMNTNAVMEKKLARLQELSGKPPPVKRDLKAEEEARRKKMEKVFIPWHDERFNHMHAVICKAIFIDLGADPHSLLLAPEQLEQAFLMIGIPLKGEAVQEAIYNTQVPKAPFISLKRFLEHTKKIAAQECAKHSYTKMRIQADLFFRPPRHEAKFIVIDHARFLAFRSIRKEYRSLPGKKPLFACDHCAERFSSFKLFEKHKNKGINSTEHRRVHQLESIHESQTHVLRSAKLIVADTTFPTFFELVNEKELPEDYRPQVFDTIGPDGRPIGVIEPHRTVMVEDVLGDFVQISFEGVLGWVRYKFEGPKGKRVLQVAMRSVPFFSWTPLRVHSKPFYFRVRDDKGLPPKLELKVRYQPLLESEVCGYLRLGQVVESRAVLGDWLQIKFQLVDSAWVLRVVGGGVHKPPPPPPTERELAEAAKKAHDEALAALRKAKKESKKKRGARAATPAGGDEGGGDAGALPTLGPDGLPVPPKEKVVDPLEQEREHLTSEDKDVPIGAKGSLMLLLLHPLMQRRFAHTMHFSPYTPKAEELVIPSEEEMAAMVPAAIGMAGVEDPGVIVNEEKEEGEEGGEH